MLRRLLKFLLLALVVCLMLMAATFFWASSSTLEKSDYAYTTVYDAPPASPTDTLTVVTYNIGYLSGMTNNQPVDRTEVLFEENMDAATDLLCGAGADAIAFQEIDFEARRSFDVQQLDALAERCGFSTSATTVNWDEQYVPFPSANPLMHFGRTLSGQAVLSRFPILAQERVVLERPPMPFHVDAFYLNRIAQVVEIDVGRPLVLINVHFEAWDIDTRERQAEAVRTLYKRYAVNRPVLLIGDFNSVLPADKKAPHLSDNDRDYFAEDETIEMLLEGTPLREAFPDTADAVFLTYPADAPTFKIDHVFYDPAQMEVLDARVLEATSHPSDHRAVLVRLAFNK